jgi:mannose-6-phosphate isomerase-like protein (cupin superfamily)
MKLLDALETLLADSKMYEDLLYISAGSMNVGFELTDTGETATLVLGDTPQVMEGLVDTSMTITMTKDILEQVMNGEADAFALAGRSHIKEKRPIDFKDIDQNRASDVMETIKGLGTFFLNPGRIKTRSLQLDLAGEAHGARPIPLVYWKGLRFAWYHVPAHSTLNEAGEKDPWPQAFVVLSGKGSFVMEGERLAIEPNTVYYIPRNSLHQIDAEDDVQLLWIAWDAE